MKEFLVLYYDFNEISLDTLFDTFQEISKQLEKYNITLLAIPDIFSLKQYSKIELKNVLEQIKHNIEELINE